MLSSEINIGYMQIEPEQQKNAEEEEEGGCV